MTVWQLIEGWSESANCARLVSAWRHLTYHEGVEFPEYGETLMVAHTSLLVQLLSLLDDLPLTPSVARRGRPYVYAARLFVKSGGDHGRAAAIDCACAAGRVGAARDGRGARRIE